MDSTKIGGLPETTALYARFSASLVAGVVASLVGAAVMALVMVVAFMAVQHTSFMYALRPIGTFLYGDQMLVAPTPTMYLAAAGFHFGVCALWGIIFAFAATLLHVDGSFGGALALGIIVGLSAQIIDINLVTPAVMNQLWGQNFWEVTVPPFFSWVGHLVFGMSFVVAPLIFRKLWRRWGEGDKLEA
jgi:hypothetical protein